MIKPLTGADQPAVHRFQDSGSVAQLCSQSPSCSDCPDPYRGPTLLQDVAIMHWNGCRVGGPTVQHQTCGASICKAGTGGVGQRASSSEQGGWKLIWPTLYFPRSSPIPVCMPRRLSAHGRLLGSFLWLHLFACRSEEHREESDQLPRGQVARAGLVL